MTNFSTEKIIKDIAIVIAISIAVTGLLRLFFDFNLTDKQVILRRSHLNRFDRCAVISPGNRKITNLILTGLPGDTIYLIKAQPFVNSKNISHRFSSLFMIDLSTTKHTSLDQYPVTFSYMPFDDYYRLRKKVVVQPVSHPLYMYDSTTYPHNPHIPWNKDNFGKFVIPHKGLKLKLNKYAMYLYGPLLEQYEGATLTMKGNKFYIKGHEQEYYTFKHDYYFFLNQNLYEPVDSRSWGPIPRSRVIGKIIQMPRWTRLLITHTSSLENNYLKLISR